MSPIETVLDKLPGAKRSGNGWSVRCPAHEDKRASLSVSEGNDGKVLLNCHAGCETGAILSAVGLTWGVLYPANAGPTSTGNGKPKSKRRTFPALTAAVAELGRQLGKRSALWTYYDAQGEPMGAVVRWDTPSGKEIRPVARQDNGWQIGAMPEPRPLYALPELSKTKLVIVVEGEKAADAARTLGFMATTSAGGSQAPGKTDWRPLAGKEVWILPDNDAPGRKYANAVAKILAELTPVPAVRVVQLLGLPESGDIVDWIDAHGDAAEPDGMLAEIEDLARAVELWRTEKAADQDREADLPTIMIGTDEYRVNDEAAKALTKEADVFRRSGMLVHVLGQPGDELGRDAIIRRPVGAPVIRELACPLLRERLSRCALWMQRRRTRGGDEIELPAHPPDWSIKAVHARGNWPGIPSLDAVVTFPAMMPNGSLLTTNGYHRNGGVLVQLPSDLTLSVPEQPTKKEVKAAVETLFDPLQDFPFETPAHRSALLAGLLTPLAWFLFDGPAPLFLIDKNVRGAGAGLLADVVALTVIGRRFSVMSYTNNREELRKRITTVAMEGERMILLDNLAGAFGNDILDAALTADRWKDRVLGVNKTYDGPLHVVWFGTGNNVQIHADTSRRVCYVRMESKEERPELRTGFRYPSLRQHIRRRRSTYLSAALTILRAWFIAGRPTHGLQPWGSFEGWSEVVREALVFAGLPDPGETRIALQTAADRDAAAMGDILRGLAQLDPTGRGLTAADIVKRLKDEDGSDEIASMRAAIEELCGKLDGRALAIKFRSFKRRNFNGQLLDVGGTAHGTNRWVVLPAVGSDRRKDPHHPHHPHPSPRWGGEGGDGGDVLPGVDDAVATETGRKPASLFGGPMPDGPYRERL